MKTIYLSVILLLCAATFATAQERKQLTDDYTVNVEKAGVEPQYLQKYNTNEGRRSLSDEPVVLEQGDYAIINRYLSFLFSINENGMLHGRAEYRTKKHPDYMTAFQYDNGVMVASRTLNTATDSVFSETSLKDSVLTVTKYYPSGQMQEVEITDYKIKNNAANNIRTTYYESGQIEKESNKIAQTFKTFSENGNPKRFVDDKNGIWISYDEDGTKESHSYRNGDEACMERYAHGVIILKECTSDKESKTYRYENGKMTYVEVYNRQTRQTTFFDAKGKPLKDKTPEPIISIGL